MCRLGRYSNSYGHLIRRFLSFVSMLNSIPVSVFVLPGDVQICALNNRNLECPIDVQAPVQAPPEICDMERIEVEPLDLRRRGSVRLSRRSDAKAAVSGVNYF